MVTSLEKDCELKRRVKGKYAANGLNEYRICAQGLKLLTFSTALLKSIDMGTGGCENHSAQTVRCLILPNLSTRLADPTSEKNPAGGSFGKAEDMLFQPFHH
jgi:hypothetical protein